MKYRPLTQGNARQPHTGRDVQVDGTRSMEEVFADIDAALSQVSGQHSTSAGSPQLAATA